VDSTSGLEIEVAVYNEFFGRWNQGVVEKQRLGGVYERTHWDFRPVYD